ncbi:MAG: DoxX family membrane protein [Acidobacteriota bacterium]|nr:DoxX family membrane protein [Acidobacteriota bacterium]
MRVVKNISKYLLAAIFILGGINHFIMPATYLRIMPSYLPAPLFLIYLSGFLETGFGIALLIPKYSRRAAFGLILLLVAVFPANINMAMNPQLFPDISPLLLYLRLPLQLVMIAWAYWHTRRQLSVNSYQ